MRARSLLLVVLSLSASLVFAQSRATPSASLPLDMDVAGGRPVLTLHLNGQPASFILDTGAGYSVIEAEYAATLGATFLENTTIGSPLGDTPIPSERVEIADVELGGLALGPHAFSTFNSQAFPMPGGAVGVLSVSELAAHHAVLIDFRGAQMHLLDQAPAGIPWSALHPETGAMTATMELGEHSVEVHLDTGSPGTVLLPLAYAEELGLADELRVVGTMQTVDAVREIHGAPFVGRAMLGGTEVPLTTLAFADLPMANVGMGLFGDNQLIIDQGAERFALIPSRAPARAAAPAPTTGGARIRQETLPVPLGLSARPTADSLVVAGVAPDSRAERAGLAAGDRITDINGVAVADIPGADLRSHMVAAPLIFTVERDGETLELAVPDR